MKNFTERRVFDTARLLWVNSFSCQSWKSSYQFTCVRSKVTNTKTDKKSEGIAKKKAPTTKTSSRYADTINLPQMPFALGVYKTDGQCNERERYIQQLTDFEGLYKWQLINNVGPSFIIHDGPPYANGKLHTGHALNKIIKDVINRYKVMRGFKVHFKPGWDCHGLPIETKARSAGNSPVDIRRQARDFSQETLCEQRQEFKEWCIMGDWDNPYITSTPKFIIQELEMFQIMYEKGLIYQDYMPVYWSPSSGTALAEAELEYNENHTSHSVYVRFKLHDSCLNDKILGQPLYALIWTTTPWTLPANRAICFSDDLNYCIARDEKTCQYYLVSQELLAALEQKLSTRLILVGEVSSSVLKNLTYTQPLSGDSCRLFPSSHVTNALGTGLVHTAPSHGHDDFKIALRYDLDKSCLVDENGCFTKAAGTHLASKMVLSEGNNAVIGLLGDDIIHEESYVHKYPYDWRSKQPVIIRASSQWFVDTRSLLDKALACLNEVKISPKVYHTSLSNTIQQRPYWCISRQRSWGVPIPTFYDINGKAHIHRAITDHIKDMISKYGCDVWWTATDDDLLPKQVKIEAGLPFDKKYTRSTDILDIWFDSGISWAAALDGQQADMYIEGVDQIRGWFQSSLLTSVAVREQAPYKEIMIHGFTVDEDGRKMSKSLGNVVVPSDVIYGGKDKKNSPAYGVDVLRWWAANKYNVTTVDVGSQIMKQHNEQLLLLRKRMRFLLGNVHDFIRSEHEVDYADMLIHDQYFLHLLHTYCQKITSFYDKNEISSVLNELQAFTTKFSNVYSTMCKDRLYCFPCDSMERRSCQTVLYYALDCITRSFAPILPLFAEDIFYHHPEHLLHDKMQGRSIFTTGWLKCSSTWENSSIASKFDTIFAVQDCVKACAPTTVMDTCSVKLFTEDEALSNLLQEFESEEFGDSHSPLCEVLQCANVIVNCADQNTSDSTNEFSVLLPSGEEANLNIKIQPTSCYRCERCRRYTAYSVNEPCKMCMVNMADTWS